MYHMYITHGGHGCHCFRLLCDRTRSFATRRTVLCRNVTMGLRARPSMGLGLDGHSGRMRTDKDTMV